MVLVWVALCGGMAMFLRWRVPGPLWLGGLLVVVLPMQVLTLQALWRGAEVLAPASPAARIGLRQATIGTALLHEVVGLLLGLVVIGSAGMLMALAQLFTGGPNRRWTYSQGGMGAFVMAVGTVLVLGFGLWGGAGGSAVLLAGWLMYSFVLLGLGCIRVDDDPFGRQHSGRVMLAYTVVVGTLVAGLAGVHLAQGANMAAMAAASPIDAAILELEGYRALDTARKAGLVSFMMAMVAAGASTGGSLPQASDPRGALGALALFAGLGLFVVMEASVFSGIGALFVTAR